MSVVSLTSLLNVLLGGDNHFPPFPPGGGWFAGRVLDAREFSHYRGQHVVLAACKIAPRRAGRLANSLWRYRGRTTLFPCPPLRDYDSEATWKPPFLPNPDCFERTRQSDRSDLGLVRFINPNLKRHSDHLRIRLWPTKV